MARVFWTDSEVEKLVEILIPMRINNVEAPLLSLLKRAMAQLPEERRRKLGKVPEEIALKLKVALNLLKDRKPEVIREIVNLDQIELDQLMSAVMRKIIIEQRNTQQLLYRLLSKEEKGTNDPSSPKRERLTRVLVVGLLPEQQHHLEKAFKERLSLRFLSKDNSNPRLPEVDYAVLCTKFVSHATQNQVKKQCPNVLHCNGSVSELAVILESLT